MAVIDHLGPATALALADALLALHVAIVVFNLAMPPLIILGAWRGWRVVRAPLLRLAHLVAMAIVAIQAWLGELCFLTVWENDLRVHAGQAGYGASFVETWLAAWLYVEAPFWVFVAAYSAWAALSLALWFLVPPRRGWIKNRNGGQKNGPDHSGPPGIRRDPGEDQMP